MQTPNAPAETGPETGVATGAAKAGAEPAAPTEAKSLRQGLSDFLHTFDHWWQKDVSGTVDQIAVIEKRRAECAFSARYLLMTCMSAGIAILGLLQGSAAVVIGAMLLSPLMDPIMGVGFALAIGDYKWLRQSAKSLAIGTAFAILFTALIVFMSPLQAITTEIAARTRPSLLDLGVAIFSSIAGAYAMIRGREGTIVGVAIATALMPPLAVVGFGLATLNATVFWGALFLFITNLTAIALTATAMARAYGFSSSLTEKHTQMQAFLIFGAFVVLAVPLFLSLLQIVDETRAQRGAKTVVEEVFGERAVNTQVDSTFEGDRMSVTATVFTPQFVENAEGEAERLLTERFDREVDVTLSQVIIGNGTQAQEEAQLAQAREQEAQMRATAEDIAERLALLAGVPVEDVTVDRERRRALVAARPLDGASLAAYQELETRINATEPEWDIRIAPPLRPLPEITFDGENLTAEGRSALLLANWAQARTGVRVVMRGPDDAVANLRAVLASQQSSMAAEETGEGYGTVTLDWDITTGESE
ncbi:TIGR00341 family protein [Erythrobacter sp. EC-HK427]|uniref:TIGR00341 family protein n=1 Tax=Erythrobacter sp. EC-HK427 TaxID=2038396 RepID=UPI0012534209|nr:TIGR00341 family protein [Erythrobacter sp. EC-HK427]VVT06452.1 Membrane protein [Erythrobacter sp. EC-HK427]